MTKNRGKGKKTIYFPWLLTAPPPSNTFLVAATRTALSHHWQQPRTIRNGRRNKKASHLKRNKKQRSKVTETGGRSTAETEEKRGATAAWNHEPFPFFFFFFFVRCSTVPQVNSGERINSLSTFYVPCEQWRVIHYSLGRAPPAQTKMH